MRFSETPIPGVWNVEVEPRADARGFLARTWCAQEFLAHGLDARVSQCSISFNRQRGTLRGMHWQEAPHGEAKLVRCTAGAIFDVVVDLRLDSRTYRLWYGVELSDTNRSAVYIPEGCAHGFLTLSDDAEVLYQISVPHIPESARGFRWDDAAIGIEWPGPVAIVSERDRSHSDLDADA